MCIFDTYLSKSEDLKIHYSNINREENKILSLLVFACECFIEINEKSKLCTNMEIVYTVKWDKIAKIFTAKRELEVSWETHNKCLEMCNVFYLFY